MAAPTFEIVYKHIHNPDASAPLIIPILVLSNTSDDDLARNIAHNTARDLPWLKAAPAHDGIAVMVGGGPSAADHIEHIRFLAGSGATVFAMNAASAWLRGQGVPVDYQVICDAKAETTALVDRHARGHLFASQVNPRTMDAVPAPTVWHLEIGDVERHFPPERVKRGCYVLLGGGASVGNSALCVAYALGYRRLELYGYDSSHRDGASHAYRQPMNDWIPTVDVEWAGRTYRTSVAMKAQAEKFQMTAQALQQAGCTITAHGDGLLQHMFNAPPQNLTERDKYRTMWRFDSYRDVSPGEVTVDAFLEMANPDGLIIDFGCGTGRAALRMQERGHEVLGVDFADNCRDQEAMALPFLEWDLTRPCPARAPYGFCADVMEHIPPEHVDVVLENIFASAARVFFRIDTEEDVCGALIKEHLHLSVFPHAEWRRRLERFGQIVSDAEGPGVSIFYVVKEQA